MNVLVVYATKSGSTADLADWIADGVRTTGHAVRVEAATDAPGPEGYDAVFVGSGIRAGNWHSAAVQWLTEHAEVLKRQPLVTFTGSLAAADPAEKTKAEVAGYTTKVVEPLGLSPVAHGSLVGAYEPKKMSFAERLIMRIARKHAAADDRDPAAVRTWAGDVMRSIAS